MSDYKVPTEEDLAQVAQVIAARMKEIDESNGDMTEVRNSIIDSRIAYKDDEGEGVSTEAPKSETEVFNEVAQAVATNQPISFMDRAQAIREKKQADDALRGTYFRVKEDIKSVQPSEIQSSLGNEETVESISKALSQQADLMKSEETNMNLNDAQGFMNVFRGYFNSATGSFAPKETEELKESKRNVASSTKTNWASDEIAYKECAYSLGGESKTFKLARQRVDWGKDILDGAENFQNNLSTIRSHIVKGIYQQYGGWGRITEIAIVSNQLIINGICYYPVIEKEYLSKFPLDTPDYIRNGCLAPLFDWKYLKKMSKLAVFSVDDVNFFVTNIADDLGLNRRIGVSSLFKICPSLVRLIIGDQDVEREELNTEKSVEIKKTVAKHKRFTNLMDGYKINVCSGTQGLQDYTFGNLKSYATNRGNKGLFRFCCGTIARAGLAGVSGVLNFGSHLVKGLFNAAKIVINDSVTPVSEEEVTN